MPPSPPLCKFPYNVNAALPQCRTAAQIGNDFRQNKYFLKIIWRLQIKTLSLHQVSANRRDTTLI